MSTFLAGQAERPGAKLAVGAALAGPSSDGKDLRDFFQGIQDKILAGGQAEV